MTIRDGCGMVASVWACGLSEQSELAAAWRAAGGGENLLQTRFLAAPLAHLGFAVSGGVGVAAQKHNHAGAKTSRFSAHVNCEQLRPSRSHYVRTNSH